MTVGANHMLGCGFVGSAVTMGSAVGSAVGAAVGSVVGSVVGAAVGSAVVGSTRALCGSGRWQTLVLCLFLAVKRGAAPRAHWPCRRPPLSQTI